MDLSHCSKVIMQRIINYLFSGKIELQDLSLIELIKMMNIASMFLLDELLSGIQDYVLGYLPDTGVNCGSIPDLVEGLILAEQFQLESIKDALVLELYRSLKDVPHIPDVVQNPGAFKRLPVNLLRDVILCRGDMDMVESNLQSIKTELDALMFWLSENEISGDDKMEITNYFAEELVTDVKKSGLFSMKMIDDRVMEILQDKDRQLNAKDETITQKWKEVRTLMEILQLLIKN